MLCFSLVLGSYKVLTALGCFSSTCSPSSTSSSSSRPFSPSNSHSAGLESFHALYASRRNNLFNQQSFIMITGLSTIVVRYLGPLLYFTSIFLSIFSFVGPVPILSTSVSLIEISPGNTTRSWAFNYVRPDDIEVNALHGRRVPRSHIHRELSGAKLSSGKAFDGTTLRLGPLGESSKDPNHSRTWIYIASMLPRILRSAKQRRISRLHGRELHAHI